MIYIIGGPGKTGSSTVAKKLSKHLHCERYYGGGYMRRESIKLMLVFDNYQPPVKQSYKINYNSPTPFANLDAEEVIDWPKVDLDKADLPRFRDYCIANNRNIDEEMELYLLQGMMKSLHIQTDVVVESKTMGRLLHTEAIKDLIHKANKTYTKFAPITLDMIKKNYKAIWLHANGDVRASRSLYKKYLLQHNKKDKYIIFTEHELREEIDDLLIRQTKDAKAYEDNYKIFDYPLLDPPSELYGHIIDSSEQSQEDTFSYVLRHLSIS